MFILEFEDHCILQMDDLLGSPAFWLCLNIQLGLSPLTSFLLFIFPSINHSFPPSILGAGIHSGHYTAVIKEKGVWWFMNDQVITRNDSKTNHIMDKAWKSSENYLLFYKLEL